MLDDAEVEDWIDAGGVPIVKGTDSQLGASQDADFLKFVYDIVQQRQDLRPVLGPGAEPDRGRDAARQHRQAVPAVRSRPQQWVDNMNEVIGK